MWDEIIYPFPNTTDCTVEVWEWIDYLTPWWRHRMEKFPRYWPFVRGIHRSPVNSQHKGQWRGALMFSLICTRINGWVNNGEAGDLRRYRAHYDVSVMPHFVMCVCLSMLRSTLTHVAKGDPRPLSWQGTSILKHQLPTFCIQIT